MILVTPSADERSAATPAILALGTSVAILPLCLAYSFLSAAIHGDLSTLLRLKPFAIAKPNAHS